MKFLLAATFLFFLTHNREVSGSGFCNWGSDGTGASSTCEGGAQGGTWCNASEDQCESGCDGNWCTGGPSPPTSAPTPAPVPSSSGFCNWGWDGTGASSTCEGGAQGGISCNASEDQCESSCGGNWCNGGPSPLTSAPTPAPVISTSAPTPVPVTPAPTPTPAPVPSSSGFCNWGWDGTGASSTCEGGAQGGTSCNASEDQCESGCGGNWCNGGPSPLTSAPTPAPVTSTSAPTPAPVISTSAPTPAPVTPAPTPTPAPVPSSSGFCNWGWDGTGASSTCEGGAQGGTSCNASEDQCESGCGGNWCTSSGGSPTIAPATPPTFGGCPSEWTQASWTHYTSYAPCCEDSPNYDPSADRDECDIYSACDYTGDFAYVGHKSFDWVNSTNIIAFFSTKGNNESFGNKMIRVSAAGKTVEALVADTCGDNDCNGCCTENASPSGYLVDMEYWTVVKNFGNIDAAEGQICWQLM
eukprot:scaffold266166_cov63-Attheya_sp.AAC.2